MQLIKNRFPEVGGLQSCLNASNNRFQPDTRELLQIMNTDPNGSGVHWFTFSTLRANSGVVNIYDSASQPGNLRSAVEDAIAKLVHTSTEMLTLHFMECQQQENTRDCGLFAIANATELAFNGNPSTVRYASGDIM